jgi:protein-S-isoprenylcysteine O-methyltransferase Ste14
MAAWTLIGIVFVMRICFDVWVVRRGERIMPDAGAVKREGRLSVAARAAAGAFFFASIALYGADPPWFRFAAIGLPHKVRWAGLLVGLGGVAFWTWTHVALGRQWSPQLMLRERHQLVTTGPYLWVRHPMYTSIILWAAGLAAVSANWLFVIMAAAATGIVASRVPKEEQMMLQSFGQEYGAYMKRTGRYLPRVWPGGGRGQRP